ncbi:helix-turn-helix transcriptional regulator [Streptomyces phaeochromogenes]|uniref:helix-turn-helix transcriptional regulator n=1 Tax=Streptomyces phaeochromogenes TaxID=1923 RepID=UPI003683528F
MTDQLLTAAQVYAVYGFTPKTLANFRHRGIGPAYVKLSPGRFGAVRYRRSAVELWLDSCTVRTAA